MSATQRNNNSYNCGNLVWPTESVLATRDHDVVDSANFVSFGGNFAVIGASFAAVRTTTASVRTEVASLRANSVLVTAGNTGPGAVATVAASIILVRASASNAVRLDRVTVKTEPLRHDSTDTVDARGMLNGQQSSRCLSNTWSVQHCA